jgi:hypothetical protein
MQKERFQGLALASDLVHVDSQGHQPSHDVGRLVALCSHHQPLPVVGNWPGLAQCLGSAVQGRSFHAQVRLASQ